MVHFYFAVYRFKLLRLHRNGASRSRWRGFIRITLRTRAREKAHEYVLRYLQLQGTRQC